ncbi:Internalin-like protein (LPXTG motif) Lmo0331 homolog [hydrothermal vent metagenome]|uniref:Internalin-like protein (LPXTG motif) Lmo0331 homolog n=1 Tax=hydrothermal vent metagenome TaxID=652676 RepID=A0A3B0R0I6_9ZZZZ
MSLKNLFSLFLLLVNFIGFSQNTYVPDDNFEQALIDLGYDSSPLDDFVPTVNIASITNLFIQAKGIADLTGIEDFTSLVLFNCTDNLLESLDLSNNTNLQILNADRNQITSVDVTKNILLETLSIGENLLTSIDISQNTLLKYFFCFINQITNLNIENNTNLINLSCFLNEISTFTIPIVNSLEELEISNNLLTSLNVSNGYSIRNISCVGNQLSNLDVTNCLGLDVFLFSDNNISSIDLSNNISLFGLWCENNPISDLDLSQNQDIQILRFGGTLLTNLDISVNSKLYRVVGNNNQYMCNIDLRSGGNSLITDFSVTNNPQLTCILVDDPIYSDISWTQKDPTATFVSNQTECENLPCNIEVDSFNDITKCESFVLPNLINGNYFTGSGGSGSNLNSGEVITNTQKIYIYNENQCNTSCNKESSFNITISSQPNIDFLADVVSVDYYILPTLINGDFYTESSGNGILLNAGDSITTTQTIYIYGVDPNDSTCFNETSFKVTINPSIINDLFIPKYFTPNNDGIHDIWKVIDKNKTINNISIFNRFGKLLKSLSNNSSGWNGTFNGNPLESNDYWYLISLNSGEIIKGHFSLKR